MALFNSGRRLKPRGFEYIPRFYDPDKEEMESIIRKYRNKDSGEVSTEEMKQRIRLGLKSRVSSAPGVYRKAQRKSSVRLIVIIAFLLAIVYLLLKSETTFKIVDSVNQ